MRGGRLIRHARRLARHLPCREGPACGRWGLRKVVTFDDRSIQTFLFVICIEKQPSGTFDQEYSKQAIYGIHRQEIDVSALAREATFPTWERMSLLCVGCVCTFYRAGAPEPSLQGMVSDGASALRMSLYPAFVSSEQEIYGIYH